MLGLTIVGAPLAYERDKSTAREEFTSCMGAKGYLVQSPSSRKAPPPNATKIHLDLPAGWQNTIMPSNLAKAGWSTYATNRNTDVAGC